MIHTVKATREGLVGGITSTGYKIDKYVPFVALPDAFALYEAVEVSRGGKSIIAIVMDVGPWNIKDHDYVFGNSRPQAESGISISGHGTNSAGIDLSEHVWNYLGMQDNDMVSWEFVEKTLCTSAGPIKTISDSLTNSTKKTDSSLTPGISNK